MFLKIVFAYTPNDKQKLIELEQSKFADEFKEKYGDKSWNESDVS